MSWICPECGYENKDGITVCAECSYENEDIPEVSSSLNGQGDNPAGEVQWVVTCAICQRKHIVNSKDDIVIQCENEKCRDRTDIRKRKPVMVSIPVTSAESKSLPILVIREIRGSDIGNTHILTLKSTKPEYLSEKIEITEATKIFGRHCFQNERQYSTISEQHCEFSYVENEGWFVKDTDSMNGTWVSSLRIIGDKKVLLKDGTLLQLADKLFEIRMV